MQKEKKVESGEVISDKYSIRRITALIDAVSLNEKPKQ